MAGYSCDSSHYAQFLLDFYLVFIHSLITRIVLSKPTAQKRNVNLCTLPSLLLYISQQNRLDREADLLNALSWIEEMFKMFILEEFLTSTSMEEVSGVFSQFRQL